MTDTMLAIWNREGRPLDWHKNGVTVAQARAAGFRLEEAGCASINYVGHMDGTVVVDGVEREIHASFTTVFRKPGTVAIWVAMPPDESISWF